MPISLRRHRVHSDMEDKILTAMIVSDEFCRDIIPRLRNEYFNVPYAKKVIKWVSDYYGTYGSAPGAHIQDIFNGERVNLRDNESSIIEEYLASLNDNYEEASTQLNSQYLLDQSIRFFKKQSLVRLKDNVDALIISDRVEEADQLVTSYKEIVNHRGIGWYTPFGEDAIERTVTYDTDEDVLYQFPGDVGDLMGPLEIQWLIGLMGPMKRGKTNWLLEFLMRGLFNRVNSVFISLEMKEKTINKRLYRRIGPFIEGGGSLVYPAMDCLHNQDNSCNFSLRTNNVRLVEYNEDGSITYPRFDPTSPYRPCNVCHERIDLNSRHIPATWYEVIDCGTLSPGNISRRSKALMRTFGDRVRIRSYPAFSANIKRIKADLDELENVSGFVAKQIIIDYADILGPESSNLTGRDKVDETWKSLKNLADTRKCLVVTATQSNRGSIKKRTVKQEDTGEDIRKIAHVDVMGTLNQTLKEKKDGIMRFGLCAHRHKDFDEFDQCLILQQIKAGQVLLDSARIKKRNSQRTECLSDICDDDE